MTESNITTPFHEYVGHHGLENITFMNDLYVERTGQNWETFDKVVEWLGEPENADGSFSGKQHEKFADGFVKFIHEGKAPNRSLRAIFQRMARFFRDIYEKGLSENVELNDSARKLYRDIINILYISSI